MIKFAARAMIVMIMALAANLIIDLAYAWIDPRISIE